VGRCTVSLVEWKRDTVASARLQPSIVFLSDSPYSIPHWAAFT
jgi:hypothetical protein